MAAAAAQVPPPGGPPAGGVPPAQPPSTGGTPPTGAPSEAPPAVPAPVADPAVYCEYAQRFTSYLSKPPVLRLVSRQAHAGKPAPLRLTVSKPAYVTLTVTRGGHVVASMSGRFSSGLRTLRWARPPAAGAYSVVLRATDPAGNEGSATGKLRVLKARKRA
jgi:hypothetical protein